MSAIGVVSISQLTDVQHPGLFRMEVLTYQLGSGGRKSIVFSWSNVPWLMFNKDIT